MSGKEGMRRQATQLYINGATQYATLYQDGKPVGTFMRRRIYERGPAWRVFDTQGNEVLCFIRSAPASVMARDAISALRNSGAL